MDYHGILEYTVDLRMITRISIDLRNKTNLSLKRYGEERRDEVINVVIRRAMEDKWRTSLVDDKLMMTGAVNKWRGGQMVATKGRC